MSMKPLRKPSERIRIILADNLKFLRRKAQLSQEALAETCGLHRTYVGSVERCERNVTLSSLEAFAQALDVSVAELLTSPSQKEHDNKPTP